ncbi:hypothetical protein ACT6QH_02625 [Xanthobacter sp. TB0139]
MARKLWVTGSLVAIIAVAAILAPHDGADASSLSAALLPLF